MAQLSQQPLRTIYNAKRFIGRSLDDEQVQEYAAAHSYKVVPVDGSVSNHSQVGFEIPGSATAPVRVVSPEQVGSDVLRHLLKVTADFLGHSQVNKAVIAVPAKFDANQVRMKKEMIHWGFFTVFCLCVDFTHSEKPRVKPMHVRD